MKAITILQPYASLIAYGQKKIETRSWSTKYRGPLAIHAGLGKQHIDLCRQQLFWANLWPYEIAAQYSLQERIDKFLPLGAVIAIAELVDCLKVIGKVSLKIGDQKQVIAVLENQVRITGNEYEFGDYSVGRYAWILDNVQQIDPVAAKGQQRLWNWAEIEKARTC
jgi:activating signal cointegrator 1